jgi:L-seryl-tRNA(Ser) seleniumtransferase
MDSNCTDLLRQIPAVETLLHSLRDVAAHHRIPHVQLVVICRGYLQELRSDILAGKRLAAVNSDALSFEAIVETLEQKIMQTATPKLCRALNATGVILHTGLGRAVLPPGAMTTLCSELQGYTVLEVERASGERSQRDVAVRELLCTLTGAEDATVVNNNAGAVLLLLAALARNKEVIVSRGQLVEIGGSFRVPEIMNESGARLVEVGCTNRTHLADYEQAISAHTIAILQVHPSNFKILGFSEEVALPQLATLAHTRNLLLFQDAGSGAMRTDMLPSWGKGEEPVISESIATGADIVTFSGDKLLGSCQAGIIVGKSSLIARLRKHPLARALRVDKITLSLLQSTLKYYLEPATCAQHIPTWQMMQVSADAIKTRAEQIAESLRIAVSGGQIEVVPTIARAGSGAFPVQEIPSYAVAIRTTSFDITMLAKQLRLYQPPVFGRICDNVLLLDPRTLLPGEDKEIVEIIGRVCTKNIWR